jgi:hypothetical protein
MKTTQGAGEEGNWEIWREAGDQYEHANGYSNKSGQ